MQNYSRLKLLRFFIFRNLIRGVRDRYASRTFQKAAFGRYWDIRKKCLSVITAIFWEVKYDRTFSSAFAFSQPSARLGALTVRRSCLRESCLSKSKCYAWCLSESKCYAWCLSKSICSTWCLKISKILVQILHAVLKLKVDLSLVLKLKF